VDMKHLAVFVGDAIEKILKNEKTVEARLSLDKIIPFSAIKKGDIIYLKQSGGGVYGQVEVDNVLFYENLNGTAIGKLRKEYSSDMKVTDEFWKSKADSRNATIIFLKNPVRFLAPLKNKKKDRRSWVILENDL
jgi:predicted transcriptional regulator